MHVDIHDPVGVDAGDDPRTVLLVHGFPGGPPDWDDVASLLAERHRVLVPHLLGFGASERATSFERLQIANQARELAAALDADGTSHVLAVGHDLGGPVVAMLAADRPDLVDAALFTACNLRVDRPLPGPFRLLPVPVVGRLVARVFMSGPAIRSIGRTGTKLGQRRPVRNDPREVRAIRTIFATSLSEYPRWFGPAQSAAESLTVPTALVWGEHDPFFGPEHARATAAGLHGAPLRFYPGGHFPQLEVPDVVVEEVEALRARTPAR